MKTFDRKKPSTTVRNGKRTLTDEQRLAVLEWIAEGLLTAEVNQRATVFKPSFQVTRQLLYQYRQDHEVDLSAMRRNIDNEAINTGLAIRAKRIEALIKLAIIMEEDLVNKKLTWLQNAKAIGNMQYDYEEFNAAEVRELRGVYDDIAKETGGRIHRTDITSDNRQIKGYVLVNPDEWPDKPE